MNSVQLNINNYMKDDCQQYASNDSGLSCNSNGGVESDHKTMQSQDFQCDDLTKSLFMNSCNGNGLIQDDDIYSYKSKMEFGSPFPNKFRSFNLKKSENYIFKNSGSFSSIIHDVETLKLSEQFLQQPQLPNVVAHKKESSAPQCMNSKSLRIIDEVRTDIRPEPIEKNNKSKRSSKKNGGQEYVSSSIKDYRGDKALNDIVTFIQGSTKLPPKIVAPSKTKMVNKMPQIKVNECAATNNDLAVTPADSGVFSDNSSCLGSKELSQSNIDADSGTQSSQFVSLNNSDEDSSHLFNQDEDFQQVLSKKQKKTSCLKPAVIPPQAPSQPCQYKPVSNLKPTNKTKKSGKSKGKNSTSSILNSKETFQHFLSNQYISFWKKYNKTS